MSSLITSNKIGSLQINNNVSEKDHGGLRITKKEYNFKKPPLISVVTVVLNNEKNLEECIKSVLNQSFQDFEYIIIDGISNDETLKIIKKYENKIHYWFSEKDNGIYDAFNKGLNYFSGNMIGFINSDDILQKNALKILSDYCNKFPNKDFYFGSVEKHWSVLYGYNSWKINYTWNFYSSHSCGFFIKKDAAKKVGYYNTKYKYHADYDYFFRMIKNYRLKGIGTKQKELFGIFRRGGFSSQLKFEDHIYETVMIRLDNKQNKFFVIIIILIKIFFNLKRLQNYKTTIFNIIKFIYKYKI